MDKPMTFHAKLCPRALLQRAAAAAALALEAARPSASPALPPPPPESDLAELFASGRMWG